MSGLHIALAAQGWPLTAQGGVGRVVEGLARALFADGHRVTVLAPRRLPGLDEFVEGGLRVVRVGGRPALRWQDTWRVPGQAPRLEAWLERAAIDVLHIHHLSGWTTELPLLARKSGARVVTTLHDYHLLCPRGQLVDAHGAVCEGPSGRCRGCTQGDPSRTDPDDGGRARAGLRALGASHKVIAPSRDLAVRMASLTGTDVGTVALPVAPSSPLSPGPTGSLRFVFIGSLIPTKGPDRLLRAFQALPAGAARLTLVGPGTSPFARALRTAATATPGVSILGSIPQEAVAPLLTRHDVLILPSTWAENSPLVVREALGAGLRVLGPGLGGTRELDPGVVTIPRDLSDEGFADMLLEEVRRGRQPRSPKRWPTPADHARWLTTAVYTPHPP